MTDAASESENMRKLGELIKDIRVAMLTTCRGDGTLRSRPMATQETEFDGNLWFFTEANAPKIDEILDDQHVNVAYADPDSNRYVSVSGSARIVRDPAKARELWTPSHKAWFPNGPDDPNIVLLRISVQQAEYWEGHAHGVGQFLALVKAVATGRRYEPGENRRITLDKARGESGKTAMPGEPDWPKGERPPSKPTEPAHWPHADEPIK